MDEVGDMSLSMQAKLLRVLQEGEFSPLGAESAVTADVRVVTATNKDLRKLVKAAQFREDLYYRLDVVTLHVPPLRDRKEDIPLLVDHFLDQYAQKNRLPRPQVSLQAMEVLVSYDWPGNVRELQSAVFTAAVFAEHGTITLESLRAKPEVLSAAPVPRDPLQALDSLDLRGLEKRAILAALARAEGNKLQAARMLGISRRALYNKIDAFGLERLIRKERGEEGE
jgi:DNA-binding NtrC family response regulator